METKKLLLLLSSYITCAFLMYACLKSNNGRTEKIDNAYMTTYINKLDEVLEKLIENNENKTSPPIIVNKITPNNNVTVIVNISADEIAKHIVNFFIFIFFTIINNLTFTHTQHFYRTLLPLHLQRQTETHSISANTKYLRSFSTNPKYLVSTTRWIYHTSKRVSTSTKNRLKMASPQKCLKC